MSELVAQLIWNGLVSGALIALVALGLTLIYGVAGFIQFAHGEMVALGAYAFLVFHKLLNWEFLPAGVAAVLAVVLIGLLMEKMFFARVREHDPMIPLVISIGLSIGFQALFLITFGPNILSISERVFESVPLFGEKILATPSQIGGIIFSFLLMGGLIVFLHRTKRGKMLRAVSSNRSIATIFGMSTDTAMSWIFGIGTGLAAVAGIFVGFEQNIEPLMGVQIAIKAFAAIILGSIGSVRGAILGAFLIGLSESLLVGLGIIPSGFTAAIPFIILIGMLLVKPEGLFGKRFDLLRR